MSTGIGALGALHISGLNTGLDTDSIVKALLIADQTKIDSQAKKKQKLEWKLEAYREIKTELKAFTQKYMSVLSADNLWSTAAIKVYRVALSGTSASAVSISAGANAQTGTMTIDSITSLAEAAHISGSTGAATGEGLSGYNVALKDLALTTPLVFDEGNISFSINGKEFTFSEDDTLQNMMNTINNDADAEVTLSYSQLTNAFTLKTDQTGSGTSLTVVNLAGNAFGDGVTPGALGMDAGTYDNGQDALLSIEGVSVTRSSNSFTIDGISYTLNKTTAEAIDFTVTQDADSVVGKVKAFIEDYNKLIEKYNAKLTEKTYLDFLPLTYAQREEMTENEIAVWEEKAKSGILRSDNDISGMLLAFRSAFYTVVGDTGLSLADIGLSTGLYSNNGKIELDEGKLKSALLEKPDVVAQLFTQSSTATGTEKFNESGLMQRLSGTINSYTTTIQSVSVEHTERQIRYIEDKIDALELILSQNQERYYRRFTAMEAAISRMNSQSSWLSAMTAQTTS
jgi:flagellar hook-associated protein 2